MADYDGSGRAEPVGKTSLSLREILLFVAAGAGVWVADAVVDGIILKTGDPLGELFSPSLHEIWLRLLITMLAVSLIYSRRLVSSEKSLREGLLRSEQNYRLLFENNPRPMWVYDLETLGFLAVNDAAVSHYGYSRDDFFSMTIKDIRPPEDIPALLDNIAKVTEGIDEASIWRHRKKDGTIIDVEIISHTLTFAGRRAEMVLANDVTQQRRLQEALRQSEERYRLLFQNSPVGVFNYDAELRIRECNESFARILRTTRQRLLGLDMNLLKDRSVLPALKAALQGMEGTYEGIYHTTLSDISIWVSMKTAPLVSPAGAPGGIGIVEDITETKRMQMEAIAQGKEYRNLFENVRDGIYRADPDGFFILVNQAFAEILGHKTPEEVIGRNAADYWFDPKERQVFITELKNKKSVSLYPMKARRADGKVAYVESTSRILEDMEGKYLGIEGILRDVTERKEAERSLREALERVEYERAKSEAIISSMGDGLSIQGADFRILYQNQAARDMIGDQVGRHCYEAYERRDNICEGCPLELTLKDGLVHSAERVGITDKGPVYVEIKTSPLRDAEGKTTGAVEIIRDITERKRLLDQVYSITHDWEETFNAITDMVTVHDRDFNIIRANKAAEKILGLPFLEKTADRKCFKYYHGAEKPPEGCPSCNCLQSGIPATFEMFEPHLNMFIEIRAIPRFDSNNDLAGLIHVVRDITERKKSEDELARRAHHAALGAEIGVALTQMQDLRSILQGCAEAVFRHLDVAFARIWTLNEDTDILELQASAGMYTHIDGGHSRVPVGKFKIGLIAQERRPHLTNNVVGDPRVGDQEWAKREGMTAFAGYPLVVGDRLLGVVAMFSKRPLGKSTMDAMASVADELALGIQRKYSEEALNKYSKELTALNTASNTLMIITDLKDIYQEICNTIYSVFDLLMVWIGIIEEGSYEVKPVAHCGYEDNYLSAIRVTWDDSPTGLGPSGTAIKTKAPALIHIDEPRFAPWREEAKKRGYVMRMAVPLMYARDRCIGVLNFYSNRQDYFNSDRIKLCQIFANQAAIAIENARLVQGLEEKVYERTKALGDTNLELQALNRELELRREEAEAASKSKTDFLANMSHELRTPLNAIMGFSDIMINGMAGPVSDKQKEFLNDIFNSGQHLLTLINDILDLSKVEAGKMELDLSSFRLRDLIEGSLIMFKEKALKHRIKADLELDAGIEDITADKRKLKQVMVNLLGNAFKFTPDGGSVRVGARRVDGVGAGLVPDLSHTGQPQGLPLQDFLEISVADTGIGISGADQQKLFQPFHQVESKLSRRYPGTGLGLNLCRRFVDLHGGKIWVESEEGKGSRFVFVIPVRQQ